MPDVRKARCHAAHSELHAIFVQPLRNWCLLEEVEGLSLRVRVYTYDPTIKDPQALRTIKDPQALRLVGAQECAVFTPDGRFSNSRYGMGGPAHRQRALEEEDCRTDLLQAAASLGIDQCD